MIMLRQLLDRLYRTGGCIFPPASTDENGFLRLTLTRHKIALPSSEYFQFLSLTDGLIFHGLRFFGVHSHKREKANYTFPSLLEVNMNFYDQKRSKSFLIVGEMEEDYITYDFRDKRYHLVDKMDLRSDLVMERFFDILYLLSEDIAKSAQTPLRPTP